MSAIIRVLPVLAVLLLNMSAAPAQAQPRSVAPIPFISGGIGTDEREAMLREAKTEGYNLKIVTAATGGAYLASVDVRIADRQGSEVLHTAMDGPWLLVKLPAGRYTVVADDGVQKHTRTVNVPAMGTREVILRWQRPQEPVMDRDTAGKAG